MARFALVTGAAGDLGRAVCDAFADSGWSLFVTDHPSAAERLEATREACARDGTEVVPATFDVTDHDAVVRSLAALAEGNGPPAAVVAGAGIQGPFAPVQDYGVGSFRRVLDVNAALTRIPCGAKSRVALFTSPGARDGTDPRPGAVS